MRGETAPPVRRRLREAVGSHIARGIDPEAHVDLVLRLIEQSPLRRLRNEARA